MCCQVERDREAFLSGCQIAPVKGVRFLGSRKTRVLPDRPGLHGIHGRVRTTQEGRIPGRVFQMFQCRPGQPQCTAASRNPLGGHPRRGRISSVCRLCRLRAKLVVDFRKVRFHCPLLMPSLFCHSVRVSTMPLSSVTKPCTPAACSSAIWILRIARHQHRNLDFRTNLLRKGQVFGIGTAQDNQVGVRPRVFLGLRYVKTRAAEEMRQNLRGLPSSLHCRV